MKTFHVLMLAAALSACGAFERGGALVSVPTSTCSTGQQWQGGNHGSELMHPGGDCIACHRGGEGPNYVVAGTVYPDGNSADDCAGVAGVNVKITDANNQVFNLTSNEAGNFFLSARSASLALPYTVTLSKDGRERAMVSDQSSGACNSCHTSTGVHDAPGRVMAP